MSEAYNIYCDESCHLENDGIRTMVLGAVWCRQMSARDLAVKVRRIKTQNGLSSRFEIKWTKVSPAKLAFYSQLVHFVFDEPEIHFRAVLIPDKRKLDHSRFEQSHDDWYYKMCFRMLEPIIDPDATYSIYLDIKDTKSERKRAKLEQVLRHSRYDHAERIIRRVQQIRSHECEMLQLTDLLIGAVAHFNRGIAGSAAKSAVIDLIRVRSGKRLDQSSWLREKKFNLFRWHPTGT